MGLIKYIEHASEQWGRQVKEILSTVTQRGQVTLPAEVRRLLGVGPKDKVAFTIEDGNVGVVSARLSLKMVFGSVRPATSTEGLLAVSEDAKMEKVEREVEKWDRP